MNIKTNFSKSKYSYFIYFVFILPLLFSTPLYGQNTSDQDKVKFITKEIERIVPNRVFSFEEGSMDSVSYDHEENTVAYSFSGKASVFGVDNVDLTAEVGVHESYVKIITVYPNDPTGDVKVSGLFINRWIPKFYANKLQLKKQEFILYPKEKKKKYQVKSWYLQPENKTYTFQDCELDSTELLITLKKDKNKTGRDPVKTLTLSGNLNIGGEHFNVFGENKFVKKNLVDWTVGAKREEIKMQDLVRAFERYKGFEIPGIPNSILEVTVEEPQVSFDNDKALTISGGTAIGAIEAMVAFSPKSKNDFLLGYTPKEEYNLSMLNPNLKHFDGIDLSNLFIVYAYSTDINKEMSLELLKDADFGSEKVQPGLVILGKYNMPDGIPLIEKVDTITMRADLPKDKKSGVTLIGKLNFEDVDLRVFKLKEAWVSLEPKSKVTAIGMKVKGHIPELPDLKKTDLLELGGEVEFDKSEGNMDLVLMMEEDEKWDTPFGFPGLSIAYFGLEVGQSGKDKVLGVRGVLKLGYLESDITGKLDTKDPMKSMISVSVNELDLNKLLSSFFDNQVTGYFKGFTKDLVPAKVKNAELTIIPSPVKIADKEYDPGLRIKGDGKVFAFKAKLDMVAAYDKGFKGKASLYPIAFPNNSTRIINIEGDASLDLTISGMGKSDYELLSTNATANILGCSKSVNIAFSKKGYHYAFEERIFNAFTAKISASGSDIQQPLNADVSAEMSADFLGFIQNITSDGLRTLSSPLEKEMNTAKKIFKNAKEAYDDITAEIPLYDDVVGVAKDLKNEAWSSVKSAEGLLSDALDDIPSRNCVSDWVEVPHEVDEWTLGFLSTVTEWVTEEVDFCINIPRTTNLKSSYPKTLYGKTVNVPVPGFNKLKAEINRCNDKVMSSTQIYEDLQKEYDSKKGKLDNALKDKIKKKNLLSNAEDKWNDLKNAPGLLTDMALGFIENPANVLNIHSARFSGNLKNVNGGMVDMEIRGSFLGASFQVTLPFDFSNPEAIAQKLVDHLIGDQINF